MAALSPNGFINAASPRPSLPFSPAKPTRVIVILPESELFYGNNAEKVLKKTLESWINQDSDVEKKRQLKNEFILNNESWSNIESFGLSITVRACSKRNMQDSIKSEKYNSVISRRSFLANAKKSTKIYKARVQPLYYSLNFLFSDNPDAVSLVGRLKTPFIFPECCKYSHWILGFC